MSDLHEAVSSEDIETLGRLILEGADLEAVDDEGRTALCLAVDREHTDMVRVLLGSGANPNTPRTHIKVYGGSCKDDSSPLMIAASLKGVRMASIVEMLLANAAQTSTTGGRSILASRTTVPLWT